VGLVGRSPKSCSAARGRAVESTTGLCSRRRRVRRARWALGSAARS